MLRPATFGNLYCVTLLKENTTGIENANGLLVIQGNMLQMSSLCQMVLLEGQFISFLCALKMLTVVCQLNMSVKSPYS